jgi:hypothetical protein
MLAAWLLGQVALISGGDEAAGIIAAGQPFATPYFVRDSGVAGPTVMIFGGLHGDEPAGAGAAYQIRHWPMTRGKLVVVPRANVLALEARRRLIPQLTADLANLNRNFPKPGGTNLARGELAAALWEFVQQQKPDWLIDLHEGSDFRVSGSQSVGSSLIVFTTPAGQVAATQMLAAVNASITNREHRFVLLTKPIAGSLARADGEHLGANAMILETTIKGQPLSQRTRQHRVLVHILLRHLNVIAPRVTPAWMMEQPPASGQTRVALYDAGGSTGQGVPRVLEILGHEKHLDVACVGPADIAEGALSQFEVVIFTGGSGSAQSAALGKASRARVRQFVEQGGGYIGICAGMYLACHGFSWGLDILDAKTVSPLWRRGTGLVKIELTDSGRDILGSLPGMFTCRYANGPIVQPAGADTLPDYEVLGVFRSELAENGAPPKVMINSPAIVAGQCGQGRVLCFSSHPEQSKDLESFIPRAVAWVTKAGK